ncbi:MAG: glycerol-3-phosphate dehydrogenase/oxidase [Cyclobacteriaceae bacterium]
MTFSASDRQDIIHSLSQEYHDIVIIGGGITGAGIALDAASRGLKVALVEKGDFASGTSSKSTKLIHGGLRYLKQMEFGLVREVGKERAIVHNLAPHLVRPEKMLLPLIQGGNYGNIITSVGLMVYDVLANVGEEDQRKMLSKEETLDLEPLLKKDVVEGGGLYAEYQTDDFRLVLEIIKAAKDFGASAINYVQVDEVLENGGIACGVKCSDQVSGEEFSIYSDYVINATGPWVDVVRQKTEEVRGKSLHLTKGIHVVVPNERLPVSHAVYFDISDGRMAFAIPKGEVTYIGTTDTDYNGRPEEVQANKQDVQYLIDAVNDMFPTVALAFADVKSSWAGIRPLIAEEGKSASEISRKDEIFIAKNKMISIAGGKLTGYRQMAKKAVMEVIKMKQEKTGIKKKLKCKTRKILLPGNGFKNYKAVGKYKKELSKRYAELDPQMLGYLVDLYGMQTEEIISRITVNELSGITLLKAEVAFSLEAEMTLSLLDFYERRTGRLYFDIESIAKTQDVVASVFTEFHGWSEAKKEQELDSLERAVRKATSFE